MTFDDGLGQWYRIGTTNTEFDFTPEEGIRILNAMREGKPHVDVTAIHGTPMHIRISSIEYIIFSTPETRQAVHERTKAFDVANQQREWYG